MRTKANRLVRGCGLAAFVIGFGLSLPAIALVPLENVASVASGGYHTCALTTAGGVKCWGLNVDSALGNPAVSTGSRQTPLDVSGLSSGIAALAAGENHTCALTTGGGVKCWGVNGNGQLGDGSVTTRNAPVDVTDLLTGATAITSGFFHSCAIVAGGGVRCWGLNNNGQLGDGTTTDRNTPVEVTGLTGVTAIVAGGNHTCALTGAGGVKCWGRNTEGQLGNSTNAQSVAPVDVTGLASGATGLIAGRYHACAITTAGPGAVKCWGDNRAGQLGDNSATNKNAPVSVANGLVGVTRLGAGRYLTCALAGGAVKCWGSNVYGQVGDNSYLNQFAPTDVTGLSSGMVALSAGQFHACAVTSAGRLQCWGSNGSGQLGDGTVQQRLVPVNVQGLGSGGSGITARGSRSCAVAPGPAAQCWGDNFNGGLGNGGTTNSYSPVEVSGLTTSTAAVSAGLEHTCALTTVAAGSGVKCWGLNTSGQVGDGTFTTRLNQVNVSTLTTGVTAVSSGYYHTCALTSGGGVRCWGYNAWGQLGNGSTANSSTPVNVSGLASGVVAISSGGYHSCALLGTGGLKCWGYNPQGQLGNGSTTNSSLPVDVTGLASGVASVSAGGYHTCAVTTGGAAKCWGYNGISGLGDGTTVNRTTAVDVSGLSSGIAALAAGDAHTCALTTSGAVKCWGYNNSALLGDYSSITRRVPVDVVDLPSGVAEIAAGTIHNCARTTGGAVKCWGFAGEGQIGDGVPAGRGTAAPVMTVGDVVVPAISSSLTHTLALDANGQVYAWGSDSHGQLGQNRAINRSTPAQVTGIPAMSRISLAQHSLAVDMNGQVWSWGENSCGQLGPRGEVGTSRPSRVLGAVGFTEVASGGCFSIARKSDGTVWGWGLVPGYGTDTGVRQLAGIANAVELAAGRTHALVRRADNTVLAFGDNSRGQLGQGGTGAAQPAIQVPSIAATAIAAGGDTSMVLTPAGAIYIWGARADQSVLASATLVPFAPSIAISVAAGTLYAVQTDLTAWKLTPPATVWETASGMSGVSRIAAGTGFVLAHAANGPLYAAGSNTAGQLGQGNTNAISGAPGLGSMLNVARVAVGAVNPSVLALKADGTLWFWGADTLGESGDGAAVGSSIPRPVTIPAKVLQVATGDRFSLAFDVNGNVWGWGDNAASSLDGTLVNRSSPAIVNGAFHVQQIAAGGAGIALYLRTDGKLTRSGTLAGATTNAGPVAMVGLDNIVSIAAGSSAYALRADNALLSMGANASGELGNGTTATSGTPVQVQGIAGTISSLAAGASRAAATTSDGRVWSWGAAPLGNGSSGASSTAVQASGITDAAEVSVGKLATVVRRQNGALMAWGDTALSDMPANPLLPYPVAFHQPVKSARIGANNAMGYLVGNSGLAWAFGRYLTVSNLTAAIGDGTYVPRPRPVVVIASNGAGNIDTDDWYFDLEPASAESIPAASTPKMLGVTRVSGTEGGLAFGATVRHRSADFGKSVNNYVFGLVPPAFFDAVKSAPALSSKARLAEKAAKNGGFVLAQLTPSGWSDVTGQLLAHSQSTANAAGTAATILSGIPATSIAGARFCIGYGESAGSMLSFNALREVLLLPGASQNTSGVPCVLSGVYVDGPAGSRVGTAVTFKASVVGLSPSGSAQFRDGAAALSGSVALAGENDAVASAQLGTSALTVGEHAIGATYFGDGQNAAASAELPLRHQVTAQQTEVRLAGPASSDEFSIVAFEATVIGLNPLGEVQFKDGAANLGAAVPLVGGKAVLRISTLALGDHGITASYLSEDANNADATSNAVAHKVVTVFNSRVTLTSSALEVVQGTSITLTATVTGPNLNGNVTFRDGTTVLGTVALANGVATLTLSNLTSGGHQLTATYASTSGGETGISATIVQQVQVPAVFAMSTGSLAFGGQLRNTVSAPRAVTVTNTGGAPLTVTSVSAVGTFSQTNNCATVAGGASCVIQVRFAPTALGAVNGSINIQTTLGPNVVALTGTGADSLVAHYYTSILGRAPDAGGRAFWDGEAVRVSALGVNVNEVWFAMAQAFYFSAEYAARNRNNTGYITDLYNTFFQRAPDTPGLNFWVSNLDQGMPREVALAAFMFSTEFVNFTTAIYGNTAVRAEVDAVVDFYRGLLARLPDDGGFAFWLGKFRQAQCQGAAAITAQVEAISQAYTDSGEYAARGRTNAQYVGDLYNAFLRRGGDLGGVLFWISTLTRTNPPPITRDQLRQEFKVSPEFQARVNAIIAQGCLP